MIESPPMPPLAQQKGTCAADCIRKHAIVARGLLEESMEGWKRRDVLTERERRKVERVEQELEHISQLHGLSAGERYVGIVKKANEIRKALEDTKMGYVHGDIPHTGTMEDLLKARSGIEEILGEIYDIIAEQGEMSFAETMVSFMKEGEGIDMLGPEVCGVCAGGVFIPADEINTISDTLLLAKTVPHIEAVQKAAREELVILEQKYRNDLATHGIQKVPMEFVEGTEINRFSLLGYKVNAKFMGFVLHRQPDKIFLVPENILTPETARRTVRHEFKHVLDLTGGCPTCTQNERESRARSFEVAAKVASCPACVTPEGLNARIDQELACCDAMPGEEPFSEEEAEDILRQALGEDWEEYTEGIIKKGDRVRAFTDEVGEMKVEGVVHDTWMDAHTNAMLTIIDHLGNHHEVRLQYVYEWKPGASAIDMISPIRDAVSPQEARSPKQVLHYMEEAATHIGLADDAMATAMQSLDQWPGQFEKTREYLQYASARFFPEKISGNLAEAINALEEKVGGDARIVDSQNPLRFQTVQEALDAMHRGDDVYMVVENYQGLTHNIWVFSKEFHARLWESKRELKHKADGDATDWIVTMSAVPFNEAYVPGGEEDWTPPPMDLKKADFAVLPSSRIADARGSSGKEAGKPSAEIEAVFASPKEGANCELKGTDIEKFVTLGYGDAFECAVRSLDFRTECISPEIAKKLVRVVKTYNNYRGEKVAEAIDKLGNDVQCIQFGRANSPVLYVQLPFREAEALVEKVREAFSETRYDEFHFDGFDKVRIWWD